EDLMGASFQIKNPNAASSCGCGNSFSVAIWSGAPMKIASWNVNSVKVRLPHLLAFLEDAKPDVLCLQEIKCLADDFPRLEIAALGYQVEALGQRAYNGVALVSREPARIVVRGLPGMEEDEQARYIEASFGGPGGDADGGAEVR